MVNTLKLFETLRQSLDEKAARDITAQFESMYDELKQTVTRADFADLKAAVRDLVEAGQRTDARLDQLTQQVKELAEAQKRTETRLEELAEAQKRTETRLEELAEAQKRTETRLEELAEAQMRTETRLEELAAIVKGLAEETRRQGHKIDRLAGRELEMKYTEKAHAYFGPLFRRIRRIEMPTIEQQLEKALSEEEIEEVWDLDLLFKGRVRIEGESREAYGAVEVSVTIETNDLDRAERRAELLRKAGLPTLPLVCGERLHEAVRNDARQRGVVVLTNGSHEYWNEALDRWMK